MAAAQTGSNTISAHRTARNKISTPTSTFSISSGSTTLSPTTGSRIIPEINMATFSGIIDNTIELHDLGEMSVAVRISFTAVMQTTPAFASGLGGRQILFPV